MNPASRLPVNTTRKFNDNWEYNHKNILYIFFRNINIFIDNIMSGILFIHEPYRLLEIQSVPLNIKWNLVIVVLLKS